MEKYKIPKELKSCETLIKATIRKTNKIKYFSRKTKPWESKLGGCPYLKDIKDYPLDEENKPMMFLAQINLSDLRGLDNLPKKGLLQFYIVNDNCYSIGKKCKVIYVEEYSTDTSDLILKHPYETKTYKENLPFKKECLIKFKLEEMPITSTCYNWESTIKDTIIADEKLEDIAYEAFYISDSRVDGYPCFAQYDPRTDDTYDRLLLQLDTDEVPKLMFGDSGVANFFISSENLRNKDFSAVFYTWDCC